MATCKVTFEPMGVQVEADPSRPVQADHAGPAGSVLAIALAHGVEIEHACGGAGVCGTCHVIVQEGMANLSEPSEAELDTVEQAPGNTVTSRLACQAIVAGDVTVRVPQWNRNLVKEGGD